LIVPLLFLVLGSPPPPPIEVAARALAPAEVFAQAPPQSPALSIDVDRAAGHRPMLRLGPVLADPVFEEAARSGLPLRLRYRVELWRDGFFDSLEDSGSMSLILVYEPLDQRFVLRTEAAGRFETLSFSDFESARAAAEVPRSFELRPGRSGRFYYTGNVVIETLSLSDLEELERWLKGDLRPAVRGNRSVPGAVGQGVKRMLVRVLGLPARHYETRSEVFRIG